MIHEPEGSAEDLLHGAGQSLSHGTGAHGAGDVNDLLKRDVTVVDNCNNAQGRSKAKASMDSKTAGV